MSDRERDVLAALDWFGPASLHFPAEVARALNLCRDLPCEWCPVGPPSKGERVASVPRASASRVRRVLEKLGTAGAVRVHPTTRGRVMYGLPG